MSNLNAYVIVIGNHFLITFCIVPSWIRVVLILFSKNLCDINLYHAILVISFKGCLTSVAVSFKYCLIMILFRANHKWKSKLLFIAFIELMQLSNS